MDQVTVSVCMCFLPESEPQVRLAARCDLLWQGLLPKRSFTGFKFRYCPAHPVTLTLSAFRSLFLVRMKDDSDKCGSLCILMGLLVLILVYSRLFRENVHVRSIFAPTISRIFLHSCVPLFTRFLFCAVRHAPVHKLVNCLKAVVSRAHTTGTSCCKRIAVSSNVISRTMVMVILVIVTRTKLRKVSLMLTFGTKGTQTLKKSDVSTS